MAKARKRRGRYTGEEIPTTSVADIAFLLICFFIMAATFQRIAGFESELPAAEESKEKSEQGNVVMLKGETIVLNDKDVSMGELRAELAALDLPSKADEDRAVRLEAPGSVLWQRYFEVMSAITNAGGAIVMVREAKEGARSGAAASPAAPAPEGTP